ncbi:MAG: cell division protein FtsZ [Clostridiales bacterium]|nr:cell division protein FtsZ [Clostridiales bacterium]
MEFDIDQDEKREVIKVMGVGGGGGNAINRMVSFGVKGVDLIALNTDGQALNHSQADIRVVLGPKLTKERGAGGNPEVGEHAAEESRDDIAALIKGTHMLFIAAGMGGGTGTGAAPVIAEIAKEEGVLTVGIVTRPFMFEGKKRARLAEEGITKLRENVDALITIPNEKLLQIVERNTTMIDAFMKADEVLMQGVQGITDLVVSHGEVNMDFADVTAVMKDGGEAVMGIGEANGDKRAIQAAQAAISSPMLEVPVEGAKKVLLNITSGPSITLQEVGEAINLIKEAAGSEVDIYWGQAVDEALGDFVRITVIATDFGTSRNVTTGKSQPVSRSIPSGGAVEIELEPVFNRDTRNEIPSFRTVNDTVGRNADLPDFLRKTFSDE